MRKIAFFALLLVTQSLGQEQHKTGKPSIIEVGEKTPDIPVVISIQKVDKGMVYFQPIVAPQFYGQLTGKAEEKITHCHATLEPIAKLVGGGNMDTLVFNCEGSVKIIIEGVNF